MPCLTVAAEEPTTESAEFARTVAQTISSQLQAASVAQEKSNDQAVRNFAGRVAQEYRQADRALTQVTEQLKIDLPPAENSRVAQGTLPGSGQTLDRTYTLEAAQAFAKADMLFDAAQQSQRVDAKLKEFAREHQHAIRELRKQADEIARAQAGQAAR